MAKKSAAQKPGESPQSPSNPPGEPAAATPASPAPRLGPFIQGQLGQATTELGDASASTHAAWQRLVDARSAAEATAALTEARTQAGAVEESTRRLLALLGTVETGLMHRQPVPGNPPAAPLPQADLSFAGFLLAILREKALLGRMLGILACLVVAVTLSAVGGYLLFRWFNPKDTIVVTNGTFIFKGQEKSKALVLVSAAGGPIRHGGEPTPWVDTQCDITEEHTLTFGATGKVNLALRGLVKNADGDLPAPPWLGPEGKMSRLAESGIARRDSQCWLHPDSPPGTLIGIIKPTPQAPNPEGDSSEIFPIQVGKSIRANKAGRLYLAVNDVWLSPNKRSCYVDHKLARLDEGREKMSSNERNQKEAEIEKDWSRVVEHQYWSVWYDDNVGSFLTTIEWD